MRETFPLQAVEPVINNTQDLILTVFLFGIYTAVLLYLGYNGLKKTNSLSDYAIGGGDLKGWWVGLSFGATYASANMFIGVPGLAYGAGTSALWYPVTAMSAFILLAVVTKRFYRLGNLGNRSSVTLPDWLGNRFNSPILRVGSALITLSMVTYIGSQIIGAGTLFETLFSWDYLTGIILSMGVIILYIAGGGMRSTILTDVVQSVFMIVTALVVFFSAIWVFDGGIIGFQQSVVNTVAQQDANLAGTFLPGHPMFGSPVAVLSLTLLGFTFILLPQLMNRVLVLENERELRSFLLSSGASMFLMSVFMIWAGLYARALEPGLQNPDAAVPVYLIAAFPNWAVIFFGVGLITVIITTTDSIIQAIASIISNDLYKHGWARFVTKSVTVDQIENGNVPNRVETNSLRVARIGVVVISLVAILFAYSRPPSLTILAHIGNIGILSGVLVPLLAAYYWKKCNKRSAEASLITGFGTFTILLVTGIISNVFIIFPISCMVSLLIMVVVNQLTGPDDHIEEYWEEAFGVSGRDISDD